MLKLDSSPQWPVEELKSTSHGESSKDLGKEKPMDSKDPLSKISLFDYSVSQDTASKSYSSKLPKENQLVEESHDTNPLLSQNSYNTLPPLQTENEGLNSFRITQFSKLWDHMRMYPGEPYEMLDDKLRILLDICKFQKPDPANSIQYFLESLKAELKFTI